MRTNFDLMVKYIYRVGSRDRKAQRKRAVRAEAVQGGDRNPVACQVGKTQWGLEISVGR